MGCCYNPSPPHLEAVARERETPLLSAPPPPRSPEAPREAMAREEGRRDKETTTVTARPRGAPSSLLPACRKVDGARGRRCPPLGRGWSPG